VQYQGLSFIPSHTTKIVFDDSSFTNRFNSSLIVIKSLKKTTTRIQMTAEGKDWLTAKSLPSTFEKK